jgi:nucleotide-binding universal stress UspA family protein
MTWLFVAILMVVAVAAVVAWLWHHPEKAPNRLTPAAGRILFPFIGATVSRSALDATLRLARAEGATLVPAYVATVPMRLALEAPVPATCESAMPLLEAIEQRAARLHVPVDARIETGRTPRHALRKLIENETYDRLVVPASARGGDGFAAADIAWLLEHVSGEIVVLRPEQNGDGKGAPTALAVS